MVRVSDCSLIMESSVDSLMDSSKADFCNTGTQLSLKAQLGQTLGWRQGGRTGVGLSTILSLLGCKRYDRCAMCKRVMCKVTVHVCRSTVQVKLCTLVCMDGNTIR